MYESEVYLKVLSEKLPQNIENKFIETYNNIKLKSVLHWSEHCTECAMPGCFKTCNLYVDRKDGKCQRFVNGVEKLESINGNEEVSVFKIFFKQWGIWETQGNNELYSLQDANSIEVKDLKVAGLIHSVK